ncbi:variable large family protein [Borrelia crocidurae]|nr:variable large family protein [Borrelia crocidurae]
MKEKKELGEIGRREERREGREKRRIVMVMMMMVMMVMGCNSGGVAGGEGKVDLAKKNSFLESLVKIGEGFQEIFGVFGSAVGDALGFSIVKSGDSRSKVGEYFKKVGKGLTIAKSKLQDLKVKISDAQNADGSTIKIVEDAILGASDIFERLIAALTKLAGVTNDGTEIGDTASAGAAVAADKNSVDVIIAEVQNIINIAEKFGIKIDTGAAGAAVAANAGGEAVAKSGAAAGAGVPAKLADEVAKADPLAMIDKIKNANTGTELAANNNNEAGALATKIDANNYGAKTNADLAAAVSLKAMTKSGKFSAAVNEEGAVKAAAVNAVNKVLGILDVIIGRTVSSNLDKIREAVKGIKYYESSGTEVSQSDTTPTSITK